MSDDDCRRKIESIDELIQALSEISSLARPDLAFIKDPAKERMDDLRNGRGVLIINPEIEELTFFHGYITEKDGIEYRIITDPHLKGARCTNPTTGEREVAAGYFLAPISMLPRQLPREGDDGNTN